MCVIIIKKEGLILPTETARNASEINPDGLGIVWLDTFEIVWTKSKKWRQLIETPRPFIAHFRYATVGKVSKENTHPFQCGNKPHEYLMMNGTIKGLGDHEKSDSRVLAEKLGDKSRRSWSKSLSKFDCRFVTINTQDRTYQIYNRELWTEHEGILYSKDNVLTGRFNVAVYGTLKNGKSNHNYYLYDGKFVGHGDTKQKYPLTIEGLPYMHKAPGKGHNVEVEVYNVDKWTLDRLDRLEGHPHFYKREMIDIKMDDGSVMKCWVYFIVTRDWVGKKLYKTFAGVQPTYTRPSAGSVFKDTNRYLDTTCPTCFIGVQNSGLGWYHCRSCDHWYSHQEVTRDYNVPF